MSQTVKNLLQTNQDLQRALAEQIAINENLQAEVLKFKNLASSRLQMKDLYYQSLETTNAALKELRKELAATTVEQPDLSRLKKFMEIYGNN